MVKPPVGPVKVAGAVTKTITILLGLDTVLIDASRSPDGEVVEFKDGLGVASPVLLVAIAIEVLGRLALVVCNGKTPLLSKVELCKVATETEVSEVALSTDATSVVSKFKGGKGCVTLNVVSTVAMIVVSTLTVTVDGSVVCVSELGKAGMGRMVVDCGAGTSGTPDSSCLLRMPSPKAFVSPLTTHLRCSSFVCRKTLLLLLL